MRLAVLAWILGLLIGSVVHATTVTVFAAASLRGVLDEIKDVWQNETGHRVVVSYAGSGTLARQIIAGAPADVFISANEAWMDAVQEAGLIDDATRRPIARNRLVMVAARDSAETDPPDIDVIAAQGPIAMGMVNSVPAGIYGKEALTALGLWQAWSPHVAQTENVRVALALVARGESPVGIVYASDAVATPDVRVVYEFPETSHAPILYPAALVTRGQEASRFLDYIMQSRDIFAKHGFGQP